MTDPQDANASTRPISVAELLAKNGTIGAPPVGGRRRRRRGNSDAVTVAELTGEIPIYRDERPEPVQPAERTERTAPEPELEPVVEPQAQEPEPELQPELDAEPDELEAAESDSAAFEVEAESEAPQPEAPQPEASRPDATHPDATHPDAPQPDAASQAEAVAPPTEAEADYAAHLARRDVDPDPIDFAPPPRRTRAPKSFSPFAAAAGSNTLKSSIPAAKVTGPAKFESSTGGAEQMSPDPVIDDDELVDLGPGVDFDEVLSEQVSDDESRDYELPSYLRSDSDTLFGGQSVADDIARRGRPGPEAATVTEDDDAERHDEAAGSQKSGSTGSAFVRGAWVVVQCILAVAFGAGLFIAFDQLWGWNTIVALVLSVLVILGLVVGVRVVRKTEDIGSTLIAVAVGALVTLGPLALLQSH